MLYLKLLLLAAISQRTVSELTDESSWWAIGDVSFGEIIKDIGRGQAVGGNGIVTQNSNGEGFYNQDFLISEAG